MKKSIVILTLVAVASASVVLYYINRDKETPTENKSTQKAETTETVEDTKITEPVKDDKKSETTSNSTKTESTSKSTDNTLKISELSGLYDEDLPLGLELNYVTVNGAESVIRLETTGSSKQQEDGPYYIFYKIHAGSDAKGFKMIRSGIYHLEGYGIEMLKSFDMEEDIGVNHEFFEWDFTSSAVKGSDKEYIAVSIPAGTEDKNQASLILIADDGTFLGEFIADVVHDTTLTGPDAEKYKNHSGDVVFNCIKDGNVTYLTPTDAMYKTDANGKKVLDSSLQEIELEEHKVSISNNKATETKTGNTYKITNATGKTFNFGDFRH